MMIKRKKVNNLIKEYEDVFAANPKKTTRTTVMEHQIITGDSLPARQKTRRIPDAWKEEVNVQMLTNVQIQEMLTNDIIRPSSSPWNSPFLLVRKKNHSMRFVCDFRGLNDVTKKDNYPIPHMRDVIDNMFHPVAYFSDAVQSSQKNWAPTTKEAFALILAVTHWHVYLAGRHFNLNSDHNPLVYMRKQKDLRGKFARLILELEEYDYTIRYIPGTKNVKADPLSRHRATATQQPTSPLEEKIYSLSDLNAQVLNFSDYNNFLEQIKLGQDADAVISIAKRSVLKGVTISTGRLKRVQNQLRIENNMLTKSGRLVPALMRNYVLNKIHNMAHFKTDKMYALLCDRFHWPNMYKCTRLFIGSCETCQNTSCDNNPPKAPSLPMFILTTPTEFIALDIAYMQCPRKKTSCKPRFCFLEGIHQIFQQSGVYKISYLTSQLKIVYHALILINIHMGTLENRCKWFQQQKSAVRWKLQRCIQ